jgi:hypothetical protein
MRTANIAHNLVGIHAVVTGNAAETRSLRDSFGNYSNQAASEWASLGERNANRDEQWRQHENDWRTETTEVRDVLSQQLGAQAELTQTLLAQLRDSAQIMAADMHQSTKVMEEIVAVDMGKQTKLLEAIHDRVGMQGNRLAETVLSVGEDISHRVDLVATVLVGEGITTDAELSPFLNEVREKLHKWAPETTYNEMRMRLKEFSVDKRLKEGEDRRGVARAESEGTKRIEARTGLVQRVSQLHSEVKDDVQKVEAAVRDDMNRVADSLKDQASSLSGQVESIRGQVESVSGDMGQRLEEVVKRMSQRIDKIGRRIDARMDDISERVASISERVADELHVIGDEVDAIASNVDMRRIDRTMDDMAEELRGISGYLEEMPLSSIKVVNMRKSMLKPRGTRSRPEGGALGARPRNETRRDVHGEGSYGGQDEYDDEEVLSYGYDDVYDDRYDRSVRDSVDQTSRRRQRERLARPGSSRRRGRAS